MLENQIPIKDLAKAVLLSGNLSDIHIKNIQTYPLIIFNGVEEVEAHYDINTDRSTVRETPSFIEYHLTFKKGTRQPKKEELEKRMKYLTDAIATLLWTGIEVRVFNKKTGTRLGE